MTEEFNNSDTGNYIKFDLESASILAKQISNKYKIPEKQIFAEITHTKKIRPNKNELIDYYSNHSLKECSSYFGVTEKTILVWARQYNYKKSLPSPEIIYNGEKTTIKKLSLKFNIPHTLLNTRIRSGFSVDEAISSPIRGEIKRIICKGCGEAFVDYASNDRKYCSRECRNESYQNHITELFNVGMMICNYCGKEKTLDNFSKRKHNTTNRYGYSFKCNDCILENKIRRRYEFSVSKAKRRHKIWELTREEYDEIVKLPCHYCLKQVPKTGLGIDRKDNNLGYMFENCLPCCPTCNRIKGDDITYEEMMELAPILRNIMQKREQ